MNDEINASREATKTNTYRVETLLARAWFSRLRRRRSGQLLSHLDQTPHCALGVRRIVGDGLAARRRCLLVRAVESGDDSGAVASGDRGIVFAGTGSALTSFEKKALEPVLAQPPATRPVLVRSSRTGNGRVIGRRGYDDVMGMIPADTLSPQKARILLMLALTKTTELNEIKRIFSEVPHWQRRTPRVLV